MGLKLANNAISVLASSLAAGATSVALAAGTGSRFPTLGAGDYFPATISKPDGTFEIVRVTARSGDTLTVTRAQEGTSAVEFVANSMIELRLTSGAFDVITFPSGTPLLFPGVSTAPTGWTKSTAHNNKALRVVSGTAGSGGSVAFTTAFSSQAVSGTISSTTATNQSTTPTGSVGSTTLSASQMPAHNHSTGLYTAWTGSGPHSRSLSANNNEAGWVYPATDSNGGSASHNHSLAMNAHTHTQDAHTHTFTGTAIDLAVQYVDAIIATKD